MSTTELKGMLDRLDERRHIYEQLQRSWNNERPAAYLSSKSRTSLDNALARLSVNFPRRIVKAATERLRIVGFRDDDDAGELGAKAWQAWKRAGMVRLSELAHIDRALYGVAMVTVWTAADGRPIALGDSPRTAAVQRDPATGDVLAGVRRWTNGGNTYATLLLPELTQQYVAKSADATAGSGWQPAGDAIPNELGVVPMTALVRAESLDDVHGTSLVEDVLDLTDAVSKSVQDAMVTSEYFARPRRYATGLEIAEDEDGNPVDPFGDSRLLQSEDPETRFGQLPGGSLDSHTALTAMLTQQIGMLSGLPGHYLGLEGDQPPNAESVRAAESQLTSAAYAEQRQLDPDWSRVAALLLAAGDSTVALEDARLSTEFASPELRTPAQAADAAGKLRTIGIPLAEVLRDPLGYAPTVADRIAGQARSELITAAGSRLSGLLP